MTPLELSESCSQTAQSIANEKKKTIIFSQCLVIVISQSRIFVIITITIFFSREYMERISLNNEKFSFLIFWYK